MANGKETALIEGLTTAHHVRYEEDAQARTFFKVLKKKYEPMEMANVIGRMGDLLSDHLKAEIKKRVN